MINLPRKELKIYRGKIDKKTENYIHDLTLDEILYFILIFSIYGFLFGLFNLILNFFLIFLIFLCSNFCIRIIKPPWIKFQTSKLFSILKCSHIHDNTYSSYICRIRMLFYYYYIYFTLLTLKFYFYSTLHFLT